MSLANGVWKAERTRSDFAPFEFSQRYSGTFTADGRRIDGTWEIAPDHKTWKKDFDPLGSFSIDGAVGLEGESRALS